MVCWGLQIPWLRRGGCLIELARRRSSPPSERPPTAHGDGF